MPLVGLASDAAAPEASLPAIYGKDDTDVQPPKALFPRLLKGLNPSSPNVRIDALTIAMVVSEDGTVESVHGLVAPQNISEGLLLTQALSAVKSWRFQPAVRDGEPVKYRQIVPLKDLTAPQF